MTGYILWNYLAAHSTPDNISYRLCRWTWLWCTKWRWCSTM